jgi:hypothetical protein
MIRLVAVDLPLEKLISMLNKAGTIALYICIM